MHTSIKWIVGCAVLVPVLLACSAAKNSTLIDDVGSDGDAGSLAPVDNSSSGGGSPSASGVFVSNGDGSLGNGDPGPCKGGKYNGTFAGFYTSHLTGVGVPIPVAGNVDLTLEQEGSAGTMCRVAGEGFEECSNVFSLQNGVITGVADAVHVGDAAVGGFPYFCTMTGTLDCKNKKLVDGWIQCTYCVGPLADGGLSCSLLDGVAGTTGVGGHFAGPLTANYDYATLAFIMGTWNGAEALAGNDGGSPGPDGGPASDYLSDSGLYLGPGDFGGSGTWNAAHH
jgi:hypothetical protein